MLSHLLLPSTMWLLTCSVLLRRGEPTIHLPLPDGGPMCLSGWSQVELTTERREWNIPPGLPQHLAMLHCCCCCLDSKSCLTLWDPMGCSPPGSSVHGISQARTLEWVAISFSRVSSWPRDGAHISSLGRCVLSRWATREAHLAVYHVICWCSC